MTTMEAYTAQLEKARKETLALAETVPASLRLAQFHAGSATPIWLMGHYSVALHRVMFMWILGQEGPLTEKELRPYLPGLRGGTPPTQNAADYEDWDTLLQRYDGLMREAAAGVAALDEARLDTPTPEDGRERFPTLRDCLHQILAHDAYHRGQLALLAKYAG